MVKNEEKKIDHDFHRIKKQLDIRIIPISMRVDNRTRFEVYIEPGVLFIVYTLLYYLVYSVLLSFIVN